MRMRASLANTRRSNSLAISIFLSVGNAARSSSHNFCSTTATPSGSARPANSSGVPKVAFSRASANTSRQEVSSNAPADDAPVRPSTMTVMDTLWLCADTKCSISWLRTRISVSLLRPRCAAICSPGCASATMASAIACRSSTARPLMRQFHQWSWTSHAMWVDHHLLARLVHLCHRFLGYPLQSHCPKGQYLQALVVHYQSGCLREVAR
ncbi:unannotated protein [freshwater metagenome]|uniref:Unannotated protein n=1 Tax=freshwater metagenome TaxID=449393 RepID=A0A6J6DJ73_9ZZZZ